jgi:hypothetical protein
MVSQKRRKFFGGKEKGVCVLYGLGFFGSFLFLHFVVHSYILTFRHYMAVFVCLFTYLPILQLSNNLFIEPNFMF